MPSRFPLKRSTSLDTIDTVDSVDTMDIDTTFVDRVCSKMKKAASPFSTLFVAGTNRPITSDSAVVKEKRGGILLSSLIRKGSDHGVKAASCEQSVYTQETTDIWKLVDAMNDKEENEHEESFHSSEEESDNEKDEHEYCDPSSGDDDNLSQSSAIVLKRRVHHRSTFDNEFKRREEERRSARETAAALVRKRNLQRHASHGECSRNAEFCRRSHRSPAARKPRRCRLACDNDSQ